MGKMQRFKLVVFSILLLQLLIDFASANEDDEYLLYAENYELIDDVSNHSSDDPQILTNQPSIDTPNIAAQTNAPEAVLLDTLKLINEILPRLTSVHDSITAILKAASEKHLQNHPRPNEPDTNKTEHSFETIDKNGWSLEKINRTNKLADEELTVVYHMLERALSTRSNEPSTKPRAHEACTPCTRKPSPGSKKTTEGPEVSTEGPEVSTEGPEVSTEGPAVSTEGPEVSTEGPEVSTEGPAVSTEGPAVSTAEPAVPTEGPEVSTEGPVVSTEGPEVSTEGPVVSTGGPEVSTEGPEVSTEGPEVSTEGPEVSTEGPEVSTEGPTVSTEGPAVSTEGPAVSTEGPEVSTEGPAVSTEGPEVSTEGPEVSTEGPAVSTEGPAVSTAGPQFTTKGPEFTTEGPKDTSTAGGLFLGPPAALVVLPVALGGLGVSGGEVGVLKGLTDADKELKQFREEFKEAFEDSDTPKPEYDDKEQKYSREFEYLEREIYFYLYTSQNSPGTEILVDDPRSFERAQFIKNATTKIICHGFLSNHISGPGKHLKPAYLDQKFQNEPMNIILVNWAGMAGTHLKVGGLKTQISNVQSINNLFYFPPARNTELVGKETARLVKVLWDEGYVTEDHIHLIGHSLGAHAMGHAGHNLVQTVSRRVARLTALDPAGPCFEKFTRLLCFIFGDFRAVNKDDAKFVDAIHTHGDFLGMQNPVGHADFYVNGGDSQPGCFLMTCSHERAVTIMAESVGASAYTGYKCTNWDTFCSGNCFDSDFALLGEHCTVKADGDYYLSTTNATCRPPTSAPVTLATASVPVTLATTSVPVTLAATPVPVTLATTSVPVTLAKTSVPITLATTSVLVTLAATSVPVTLATTSVPVTLATTSVPVTLATPSVPVTLATTSVPVTLATTSVPVTLATPSVPITLATTSVPVTLATTSVPVTLATTSVPVTLATTNRPQRPPTSVTTGVPPTVSPGIFQTLSPESSAQTKAEFLERQLNDSKRKALMILKLLRTVFPLLSSARKNITDVFLQPTTPPDVASGPLEVDTIAIFDDDQSVEDLWQNIPSIQTYNIVSESAAQELKQVYDVLGRFLLPNMNKKRGSFPFQRDSSILRDCGGALSSRNGSITYVYNEAQSVNCLWVISSQLHKDYLSFTLKDDQLQGNSVTNLSIGYFSNSGFDQPDTLIWKNFDLNSTGCVTMEIPGVVAFVHLVSVPGCLGNKSTASCMEVKGFFLNFQGIPNDSRTSPLLKFSSSFENRLNLPFTPAISGPNGKTYAPNQRTVLALQPPMTNVSLFIKWYDIEKPEDFSLSIFDSLNIWTFGQGFQWRRIDQLQGELNTDGNAMYEMKYYFNNDPPLSPMILTFQTDDSAEYSGFEGYMNDL